MPVSSGRSIRIRTIPVHLRRSTERIARTGGSLSPACSRPSTVSSLSASDSAAHVTAAAPSCSRGRRRIRFDADRQVVVVDRLPDLLRLPFLAGVDAAHRALQLGELEDHVGREIGLREPRRRCRCAGRLRLAQHLAGDPRGQLLDALGLVAIAAKLLVKQHRVQPLEPRLERRSCDRSPRRTAHRAAARRRRARRSSRSAARPSAGC